MGMFSEKIRLKQQVETFFVTLEQDGAVRQLRPRDLHIQPSTFNYLARNHYHRNESAPFLEQLIQKAEINSLRTSLYRITYPRNAPLEADTILVTSVHAAFR